MVTEAPVVTPAPRIPMVERDEELAALQNTYRGIREAGSFLVIEGEAGIGKTRLAEEFLTRLRALGRL